MNERPKNNKEETRSSWEGTPFAKMMRKMMNQQGGGLGFNCAEIIQKMTDQEGGCCGFDRSEIMSQMMPMCCRPQDEKEETREEGKEAQAANK
jgi:hypothetical protein